MSVADAKNGVRPGLMGLDAPVSVGEAAARLRAAASAVIERPHDALGEIRYVADNLEALVREAALSAYGERSRVEMELSRVRALVRASGQSDGVESAQHRRRVVVLLDAALAAEQDRKQSVRAESRKQPKGSP